MNFSASGRLGESPEAIEAKVTEILLVKRFM
jgi:hypothetical protein